MTNKYKIEHKILTLAHCAVMEKKDDPASFEIDGVKFSHWDFNHRDGWLTDAWLATSTIEAENFHKAFTKFIKKLSRLIPRISLISQSYIEYLSEPFIVHKEGSDTAFFRYTNDTDAVGLMFMEGEQEALKILLDNKIIPEAFYYYWNDAVNVTGYSAKLLLMFSAIEAMVKKNGKKDWSLINEILGVDLVKELFGTKEEPNTGLRHRLVHGEYFGNQDNGKNYLELVHNKVIKYFNDKIFQESLIHENVTHPQRHFFGNKQECKTFVKIKTDGGLFSLKDLLKDFSDNGFRTPEKYDHVFDDKLNSTY
ncbi:MAG: hypothetical protein IPJ67_05195 [Candidatus Moraniibacteriota bacterium]|nr:MAG: hypothetical protein IPJ67_05195 [Candidatus Moranbacteria bacterium]